MVALLWILVGVVLFLDVWFCLFGCVFGWLVVGCLGLGSVYFVCFAYGVFIDCLLGGWYVGRCCFVLLVVIDFIISRVCVFMVGFNSVVSY